MEQAPSNRMAIAGRGLTATHPDRTFGSLADLARPLPSALLAMRDRLGLEPRAESLRSAGPLLAAALTPLLIVLATRGEDTTQRYLLATLAALVALFGITAGGTTPTTRRRIR